MFARNTILVIVCALMVLVVFRGHTFAQEKESREREIDHKEKRTERQEGEREDKKVKSRDHSHARVDRRDRDVRHDIVIKRHPPVERREIRGRAPSTPPCLDPWPLGPAGLVGLASGCVADPSRRTSGLGSGALAPGNRWMDLGRRPLG